MTIVQTMIPDPNERCIEVGPAARPPRRTGPLAVFTVAVFGLSGCASNPQPHHSTPEFHPPRTILEAFDANHDGVVTHAEMERYLHAAFAKADAKQTGCLDAEEARIVNQQRWEQDQSTASPLVDFKGNGCIDFDEFAAIPRSLFEQMDANGDGKVTSEEMYPRGPSPSSR